MPEENTHQYFCKEVKISEEEEAKGDNLLLVSESSNMQLGRNGRISKESIILAKYLHRLQEEGGERLQNQHVLDLGAGTGLISLFLARMGATCTVLEHSSMLPLVRINRE